MTLPTNSNHITKLDRDEMIEIYGGEVDSQFAKKSMMREFFTIRPITGSDTATVRRISKTTLKAVTPGVRPDADPVTLGKVSVTVDTMVIARNNVFLLDELQSDVALLEELSRDHGKTLGKFFDEAFLIMGTKATRMPAPAIDSVGAGRHIDLTTGDHGANAHKDPDVVTAQIMEILTQFENDEIDTEDLVVFVSPATFQVLLNNDKLVSRDFSEGADFAKRVLYYIGDARIVKTARLPKGANTNHELSNAGNSNAYDTTADDGKIIALVMDPMALLSGETIALQSDIWFNKEEKQWFIDSFMAFAVAVRRPDLTGGLFKE